MIADRPKANVLGSLFQDSHEMFTMRIQHLGNTAMVTSDEESETLRLMLDTLIWAKKSLQSQGK